MEIYQLVLCAIVCFLSGRLFESFKQSELLEKEKSAYLRMIKCFYNLKSSNEAMESIIYDAIALGADLRYVQNSADLYTQWVGFRNYGVRFATEKCPKWEGEVTYNVHKNKIRLSDHTIYTPINFEPINLNLERYKHLKSENIYNMKL